MDIQINNANNQDFNEVSRLHAEGIPEGFLSTLGKPFLSSLYKGISEIEDGGVLVVRDRGRTLGFLAYTRDVKTCYKSVLKSYWPSLIWSIFPNVFRLTVYRKVIETLLYPLLAEKAAKETTISADSNSQPRPELLSMAVDESARGTGIGKRLVAALDHELRESKIPGYYVVTHSVDERSNHFYLCCGFKKIRKFENHGKPMNEYFKMLSK